MPDMLRQIVYPTFVVVLIASVWALGWEKSHNDRVDEGVEPPTDTRNAWMLQDDSDWHDESSGPISATTFDYE